MYVKVTLDFNLKAKRNSPHRVLHVHLIYTNDLNIYMILGKKDHKVNNIGIRRE